MQVIWAPLSDEARANYNEAAAVAFFKANEGMFAIERVLSSGEPFVMASFRRYELRFRGNALALARYPEEQLPLLAT